MRLPEELEITSLHETITTLSDCIAKYMKLEGTSQDDDLVCHICEAITVAIRMTELGWSDIRLFDNVSLDTIMVYLHHEFNAFDSDSKERIEEWVECILELGENTTDESSRAFVDMKRREFKELFESVKSRQDNFPLNDNQ